MVSGSMLCGLTWDVNGGQGAPSGLWNVRSMEVSGVVPASTMHMTLRMPAPCAAGTADPCLLHRRALDRTVRTEHAAVAPVRAKQGLTPCAFMEIDADVGRHHLD